MSENADSSSEQQDDEESITESDAVTVSTDWEERCHDLERSLERFRDQALRIRNTLSDKMYILEQNAASAESTAEESEQKLKAMEQKLLAMNWKPRDMDKHVQELSTRCEEKDRVIEHLEHQLEQQHQQRVHDAQVVEEKANRIKKWVSSKLTELEGHNHALQSENDLLREQVDILRDRLNSLPAFAAKEIFRVSFQESISQVSSPSTNQQPLLPRQHSSSSGDDHSQNDADYRISDISSGDIDIGELDSVSDESLDDIENDDNDPIYYEVDENHESKYEPTNFFPASSFHPPKVRIERKIFKDVTLLDSFISSSNGSEETLHKNLCERILSRGTSLASEKHDFTSDTETDESKKFSIHEMVEDPIIIGDQENFPMLLRSPRLPYMPHPANMHGTPPFVKKCFTQRLDNFSAMATLPRSYNEHNLLKNRNIYMADDLSPCIGDAIVPNGYLHDSDDDVLIGEHITICTNNARPQDIHLETPPVSPVTKCSSQTDTHIQSVTSKGSKCSELPMTESFSEICTFENLYRDVPIPVYATLNGRAARIRNCPFTEDSSCDSSDEEPTTMMAGGVATAVTPELLVTMVTKATPNVTLRKQASNASTKRVVSCHSVHSVTSSDYALPPDEASNVNDSDSNEPEHKLLKTTHSGQKFFQDTFERCGYLSKLGGKLKKWKRRWFVLHSNELVYYKSQHDILRRPQGQISLDGQTTVTKSHGELTFEVTNSKRTYYLTADTPEAVDQWIKAMQHSLKRQATNLLLKNSDSKLVHKGWLVKVKNGTGHRCWCVLMSRHFVYYRHPTDKIPISQVDLQGSRVEDVDTTFDSDDEHDHPLADKHVIAIWRQGLAPIYLVLPDRHEKDTWLYHLTVAAGGGMGNVGTEFEQLIYKLIEVNADCGSVYWKHPLLLYTKEAICKPLTTLSSENLQMKALELFRLTQKFVGTLVESPNLEYHVLLLQSIVTACLEHPELQNELYCQLMKQTSRHPVTHKTAMQNLLLCGKHSWFLCDVSPTSPTSSYIDTSSSDSKLNPPHFCLVQAWQMLSLSLALFLPKQSVLWLLRVHLQKHADSRHDIGKYAIFCQRALERTILRGGRKAAPSRMEILSILLRHPYHHSQPISIPVHFVNNNYQVVSFDGSSTISEFTHTLTKSLNMRESAQSGFALLSDDPGGTDMEHYLQPHFKVCDVIAKWEQVNVAHNSGKSGSPTTIRIIYKHRLRTSREGDEAEREKLLLVYQINSDMISDRFPLNRDLAIELASLMAQIEYGDIRPSHDPPSSPVLPPRSPLLPPRSPMLPPRSPITSPRTPQSPILAPRSPLVAPRSPCNQSRSPITVPRSPSQLPRSPTSLSHQLNVVVDKFYPKHYSSKDAGALKCMYDTLKERWQALHGRTTHDCVRVYLTVARKWPYCGSKLVSTTVRGSTANGVWLAIHEDGLAVLEHSTMQCMQKFDYKSVVTFGGWNTDFMIVVNQLIESAPHHYEHRTDRILFTLNKPQILEVTLLMASYINNRVHSLPDDSHVL